MSKGLCPLLREAGFPMLKKSLPRRKGAGVSALNLKLLHKAVEYLGL